MNSEKNNEKLICLDANSLYPSAMALYDYPIGKFKLLPENIEVEAFKWYLKKYMLIAEVELNGNGIRFPLIPYRNEKGNLLYLSEKFTGIYTSVEILEALHDGYTIEKFIKGVYWITSVNIFGDLVKKIYTSRQKHTEEGNNGLAYTEKILLNSMYGKMFENITSEIKFFKEQPDIKKYHFFNLLKNGEYEILFNNKNSMPRKPNYLGAFITSYARKIMNNLIRKIRPKNIFYGDTDSLYISSEAFEKSGLNTSFDLGGFKNDYGENQFITKAIFLDLKRYYLEITKEEHGKIEKHIKYKFNGINFTTKNALANFEVKEIHTEQEFNNGILNLYEWFYNNSDQINSDKTKTIIQKKWLRSGCGIIINELEMTFQVNPHKRYLWINDISYPIDLDYHAGHENFKFHNVSKISSDLNNKYSDCLKYSIIKDGIKSKLPLSLKENNFYYKGEEIKLKDGEIMYCKCIESSYYINLDNRNKYYLERINGKTKIYYANEFYGKGEFCEEIKKEDEINYFMTNKLFPVAFFSHINNSIHQIDSEEAMNNMNILHHKDILREKMQKEYCEELKRNL
jgi:hypothetical protein